MVGAGPDVFSWPCSILFCPDIDCVAVHRFRAFRDARFQSLAIVADTRAPTGPCAGNNSGNNWGNYSGNNQGTTGELPGNNLGNKSGSHGKTWFSGDERGEQPGEQLREQLGSNRGTTGEQPGNNSGNSFGNNSGEKAVPVSMGRIRDPSKVSALAFGCRAVIIG